MRKLFPFVALATIIVAILLIGGRGGQVNRGEEKQERSTCKEIAGEATIVMRDETYEPQDIQIKRCTKVTFKNTSKDSRWPASNIHPTHGIYPEFDPQEPVESGSEWSFVFDKVGPWKYHDHLVPSIRGTIVVSE